VKFGHEEIEYKILEGHLKKESGIGLLGAYGARNGAYHIRRCWHSHLVTYTGSSCMKKESILYLHAQVTAPGGTSELKGKDKEI
jgi:hypothetical protein